MAKVTDNQKEVAGDATVRLYWSPENGNYIVGTNPQIKFVDHVAEVSDKDSIAVLENSAWKNIDFFRVYDKAGDDNYKKLFMAKLRKMLLGDPDDEVKYERSVIAITSLFSDKERQKYGISLSNLIGENPDLDGLILSAINNKYVEGI